MTARRLEAALEAEPPSSNRSPRRRAVPARTNAGGRVSASALRARAGHRAGRRLNHVGVSSRLATAIARSSACARGHRTAAGSAIASRSASRRSTVSRIRARTTPARPRADSIPIQPVDIDARKDRGGGTVVRSSSATTSIGALAMSSRAQSDRGRESRIGCDGGRGLRGASAGSDSTAPCFPASGSSASSAGIGGRSARARRGGEIGPPRRGQSARS